ncbi:MAG: GNAT family protein [Marmoricola sp.]
MRPLTRRDAAVWRTLRASNALAVALGCHRPHPGGGSAKHARGHDPTHGQVGPQRENLPFVIEIDGQFVGQVNVSNVVRGSAQFASIGYWIDRAHAGQGITTRAVAMAIDHCFFEVKLHRIEIAIRPENTASLRIVEKLQIPYVGFAPRYLHIDGDWRDHKIFAITREDVPIGVVHRLDSHQSHQ